MNQNIAIAVVADFKFLYKHFNNFYLDLTKKGKYKGTILIITFFSPTFLIKNTILKKY